MYCRLGSDGAEFKGWARGSLDTCRWAKHSGRTGCKGVNTRYDRFAITPLESVVGRVRISFAVRSECRRSRYIEEFALLNRAARIPRYISLRERSEEHTSELQSLMRISYAVFCLKKKTKSKN